MRADELAVGEAPESDSSIEPTPGPSPYGPLPYGATVQRLLPALDRSFKVANRGVVPILRSGLGPLMGNPVTGYILSLRTRGRRSGAWRDAPLAYAIQAGAVYVIAGFGQRAGWFRNLQADPRVEVRLPGASFEGLAEEVTDPEERRVALRAVLRSCGLLGPTFGLDPWRDSDEALERASAGLPLVRVRPTGVIAGPADPGGRLWVGVALASLWVMLLAWRRLARPGGDPASRRR